MNGFVHGSFVYGACLIAGNGNTVSRKVEKARFSYRHPERSRGIFFAGKAVGGASRKRLSEGVVEKGDEKDFSLRSK